MIVQQRIPTWQEVESQVSVETLTDIPANSLNRRRDSARILEKLNDRLDQLAKFESYDPHSVPHAPFKTNYKVKHVLQAHSQKPEVSWVLCLGTLSDGRVVSGHADNQVRVWTQQDEQWSHVCLKQHEAKVVGLQVLPDDRIVTASSDGCVCIWSELEKGRWENESFISSTEGLYCFQALDDGRIVTGANDGVRIWKAPVFGTWGCVDMVTEDLRVRSLHVLPNRSILVGAESAGVNIYKLRAWSDWSIEHLDEYDGTVYCVQGLPNGEIFSGGGDSSLLHWSKTQTGLWERELVNTSLSLRLESPTSSLRVLRDGRVVTPMNAHDIGIWSKIDFEEWKCEKLSGHTAPVECLRVLSDGRILSGGKDSSVIIWDGDAA